MSHTSQSAIINIHCRCGWRLGDRQVSGMFSRCATFSVYRASKSLFLPATSILKPSSIAVRLINDYSTRSNCQPLIYRDPTKSSFDCKCLIFILRWGPLVLYSTDWNLCLIARIHTVEKFSETATCELTIRIKYMYTYCISVHSSQLD